MMVAATHERLTVITRDRWIPDDLAARIAAWSPRSDLGRIVKDCFRYLPAEAAAEMLERVTRTVVLESSLSVVHIHGATGQRDDYGIVSRRAITDAGVAFLVDAWQGSVEMEVMRYHGIGTGTNAAAASDTALQTELTTEYVANQRAQGTLTESSAPVFVTVGTITLDSGTPAVTEHGVLSQQATGGGTLWDRHTFSAINLVGASGDSISATYSMTASAGG